MRYLFLLSLILLFSFVEIPKGSQYYRADGKLKADTMLRISSVKLTKWMKVEDTITKILQRSIQYPAMARDAWIQEELIISFNVDDSARFSDIKMESDTVIGKRKMFLMEFSRCLMMQSGWYRSIGFKAAIGKKDRYYFPVVFLIRGTNVTMKADGRMMIVVEPPPVYEPPKVELQHHSIE